MLSVGKRGERNWTEFGVKGDYRGIEHRSCFAQPRTKQGSVCGFLMMRVMGLVRDRLS